MSNRATQLIVRTASRAKNSICQMTIRDLLALAIVLGGLLFTGTMAWQIICTSKDKDSGHQLVLTSILPLVGTWVGTVLAFYFAKDNFESAAKSTRESMGLTDKLHQIGVADPGVMMPITLIHKLSLSAGEDPTSVKLTDVLDATESHNRLPIVDSKGAAVFIVHRSIATAFVTTKVIDNKMAADDVAKLTLGHMKQERADLFASIKAMVFVRRAATLAEAKRAMEAMPNCRDVFVTETGLASEPVVGWVSNIDIARLSNAERS